MTPTNKHADMTIREYARTVFPTLKPDARQRYLGEVVIVADEFASWLGEEIAMADVTPEMVAEYQPTAVSKWRVFRLRTMMRTYDPLLFRRLCVGGGKPRRELDRGEGSEFLLSNLYLNRYEPIALRTRRPNTKRLYKTTLLKFDEFLGRSATLDDLTDDTVSRFAAWRIDNGLSKRSVNKDLFNLLALWRWSHRKGLVDDWPDVEMEKPVARTPEAWTEAEMRKLYVTVAKLPGRVGIIRARSWWPALLLVLWNSAERIDAVMHLKWEDVDLSRKWLRFSAEFRKGGRDDSIVKLSCETVAALKQLPKDGDLVFPWPFSKTYLWYELGRINRLAGLPDNSRSKFHRIRRTVASYAEAAGANATAMLRHSKREITESYLDPKITKPQQPIDVLFRLTDPKST